MSMEPSELEEIREWAEEIWRMARKEESKGDIESLKRALSYYKSAKKEYEKLVIYDPRYSKIVGNLSGLINGLEEKIRNIEKEIEEERRKRETAQTYIGWLEGEKKKREELYDFSLKRLKAELRARNRKYREPAKTGRDIAEKEFGPLRKKPTPYQEYKGLKASGEFFQRWDKELEKVSEYKETEKEESEQEKLKKLEEEKLKLEIEEMKRKKREEEGKLINTGAIIPIIIVIGLAVFIIPMVFGMNLGSIMLMMSVIFFALEKIFY